MTRRHTLSLLALAAGAFVFLGADRPSIDMRRGFHLERREILLGEPLLVEFRIEIDGPGVWHEPINTHVVPDVCVLDGDFKVFMRQHEDDSWVADECVSSPPIGFWSHASGMKKDVTSEAPYSHWLPVQTWLAIEHPGTYDLYAVRFSPSVDYQTGLPRVDEGQDAAPLIPVPNELGELLSGNPSGITDYAHFEIVIRESSDVKRSDMVRQWTELADQATEHWLPPMSKAEAARAAIWFARQDDFLSVLERWATGADYHGDGLPPNARNLHGVALRGTPRSIALLLAMDSWASTVALGSARPEHIPAIIPMLIDRLAHPRQQVRAEAYQLLELWTRQSFNKTWEGSTTQRPTIEEGRAMQPLWQAWWATHQHDFTPRLWKEYLEDWVKKRQRGTGTP